MRTRLIDSIQGALKHRIGVQDLHVQPYGSFVSQQYNAGSDLGEKEESRPAAARSHFAPLDSANRRPLCVECVLEGD